MHTGITMPPRTLRTAWPALLAPVGLVPIMTLSILAVAPARATPPDAPPLAPPALRVAFEQAWQHHPQARANPERRQADAAQQAAAGSWLAAQPALSLSTETDRLHRDRGEQEHSVALSLPLRWPSQRLSSMAHAHQTTLWRDAEQARARWALAGTVREAWWECQRAAARATLAARQQDHAQALADDVARRVAAGDLARADSHQARMTLARATAELAQAKAEQDAARQHLQATLGTGTVQAQQTCDGAAAPENAPEADAPGPDAELATLEAHPAWVSWQAQATLQAQALVHTAALARGEPEVTVGWLHKREQHGERPRQAVALALRLPLGAAPGAQAATAQARADAALAAAEGNPLRQRLLADWHTARTRHDAASRQLAAAQTRAALARDTLGFFERAFQAGEADLPALLRVAQEAFDAEQQAVLARIDAAASVSALRQAAGLLPQ